jgi:hypothetical protein
MRASKLAKADWVAIVGAGVALLLFFAYFKAIGGVVTGYSGLD